MVSQASSVGYTIMGKTADLTAVVVSNEVKLLRYCT